MYCDCSPVILLPNLLSFKYYQNESIQTLLCSRAIILLLLTETIRLLITIITKTIIEELYLNRMWHLDIRKSK